MRPVREGLTTVAGADCAGVAGGNPSGERGWSENRHSGSGATITARLKRDDPERVRPYAYAPSAKTPRDLQKEKNLTYRGSHGVGGVWIFGGGAGMGRPPLARGGFAGVWCRRAGRSVSLESPLVGTGALAAMHSRCWNWSYGEGEFDAPNVVGVTGTRLRRRSGRRCRRSVRSRFGGRRSRRGPTRGRRPYRGLR